jgi:hypothetical protein
MPIILGPERLIEIDSLSLVFLYKYTWNKMLIWGTMACLDSELGESIGQRNICIPN